jgi:ABC-type transporter Mla maintaining outer membrane lipid asymmetry permease subunit MlaE
MSIKFDHVKFKPVEHEISPRLVTSLITLPVLFFFFVVY